jgi:hypothetical protein
VTPDEVFAAVVAFLDQFISRGAAPDILELRESLGNDPDLRRRLVAQLPGARPSVREAFDAMAAFFDAEYERGGFRQYDGGSPGLFLLTDWMSWIPNRSGDPALDMTGDPAQWHDWLASVERGSRSHQPDS